MIKNCKLILGANLMEYQCRVVFKRLFNRSYINLLENDLGINEKAKGKISVTRKKLNPVSGSVVLEWKSAASVIKKFNLENKFLYGPTQTSRRYNYPKSSVTTKVLERDQIIQQETQIPLIEPVLLHENIVGQSTHVYNNADESQLNEILTFPLENKSFPSAVKINKLNHLRKYLESLSITSMPSVSLILQKTMPENRVKILERWKENMIQELGEEGFQIYHKALLDNGSSLHNNISSFLSSTPESELEIKKENTGHWKSLEKVLPLIEDVRLLEENVKHPFLCYKGVVDCFAKFRNNLVVIDWKTSKKPKPKIKDVFDNPIQLAAYVGALNFDPKFQYLVSKGLIVVAYESGMPATLHFIDQITMKHYWNEWLKRVKKFWEMKISEMENL